MDSNVVVALVMNINDDSISSVNIECWSWKLAIYCQDVLCTAQSRVWRFFHLKSED